MRRNYHEFCEYPVRNLTGEAIPAFACLQVSGYQSFQINGEAVIGFTVKKPDGKGKLYLINSPYDIPAGGQGEATDSPGSFVLFEGELQTSGDGSLVEWGPKKDSWAISKDGKGFVIVGQEEGEPGSEPGFPPVASTKRVRVAIISLAKPVNRIQGTVVATVSETTLEFPIADISVLSGTDPRPEPVSPVQFIIVQNNLRKKYTNGVDRVIAEQSEADQKWYVQTSGGGGANRFHGRLVDDLRITDATVRVQVEQFTGAPPVDGSGIMTVKNVQTHLSYVPPAANLPPRYVHCGNAGGHCTGTEFAGEWYLDTVEAPVKRPTRETS